MACGQSLYAVRSGMAECTPNLRASYDAAETTPRSFGRPPTTTAFPSSAGSNNSSTETKKASMSTWKMVFIRLSGRQSRREYPRNSRQVRHDAHITPARAEHFGYAVPAIVTKLQNQPAPGTEHARGIVIQPLVNLESCGAGKQRYVRLIVAHFAL